MSFDNQPSDKGAYPATVNTSYYPEYVEYINGLFTYYPKGKAGTTVLQLTKGKKIAFHPRWSTGGKNCIIPSKGTTGKIKIQKLSSELSINPNSIPTTIQKGTKIMPQLNIPSELANIPLKDVITFSSSNQSVLQPNTSTNELLGIAKGTSQITVVPKNLPDLYMSWRGNILPNITVTE
jgi:hypothetical protein